MITPMTMAYKYIYIYNPCSTHQKRRPSRRRTCADQPVAAADKVQRAAGEVRLHSIELVGGLATPGAHVLDRKKQGPKKNGGKKGRSTRIFTWI